MIRSFIIFFTAVVTSLYYFPFELVALPGINTKMAMAVVGILVSIYRLSINRNTIIPKNVFVLSIMAGLVSLAGFLSVVYNNTIDLAYATYLISMWVWLSAALVVCTLIEKVHGKLNVPLVCHYLVAVSVGQCLMALLIDFNPAVKNVVDTYISQDQEFLNEVERLYGIGAWLDVAGTRFSACLIMIAILMNIHKERLSAKQIWVYMISYAIIGVVGNMVARTTSVGIVISLLFLLVVFKPWEFSILKSSLGIWRHIVIAVLVLIPIVYVLYTTNDQFRQLFRFAFEALFNFIEKGEWETSSTNRLQTMYVFPESWKTWIIGDGYFSNPYSDPNFVGKYIGGYYMGTDVGYLRFIFYSGLAGLIAFSTFMIYASYTCMVNLSRYRVLFVLLLLSNFVIWLKVATDIFLVFALFICVANLQGDKELDTLRK